ncbi:hypothetical protein CAY59_13275 [Vibrio campbellii]|nr:hypothetical protein CAY59_13275 [Vibrio campbellii]
MDCAFNSERYFIWEKQKCICRSYIWISKTYQFLSILMKKFPKERKNDVELPLYSRMKYKKTAVFSAVF